MEIFKRLFFSLNDAAVKYMVVGGVAVNLYGIERSTADIDIVLLLSKDNILKFIGVATELGLRPKIPEPLAALVDADKRRVWIGEKGLMVFSLYDPKQPFFLLDIMIDIPFDFDLVYKQRKDMKFENQFIPVVPLSHLIEMKEKAGRPQDVADVYYLSRIREIWDDDK